MELQNILDQIKEQQERLTWEGTFAEYFEKVVESPELARLSHARIYDAIQEAGVQPGRMGKRQFRLFSEQLYGIEDALEQVVEYFGSAARRLETRKRILLLIGPPASGKSTLVNLIKAGLERYTRTDQGAVYAIKDCPMQEEPLHLIPPEYRDEIEEKYGLHIEGDLCPHCRWTLNHRYRGNIDKVEIQRVTLSESMGIGIGTFVATDPGSQELSRLTGSMDTDTIEGDRLESFGKGFRLNGEFNVANRGLMEFVEIFKLDERFLSVLLELTEAHKIKAPGFGVIYADEAILAHSNEAEYEAMVNDEKTAGLQDRLMVVRIPYNLRVSEEQRIYEKMLSEVDLRGTHISPLCLPLASIFAVLSRLGPPDKFGMSLIQKLRLYDGQYVEKFTPQDAQEMQERAAGEGFKGVSPRYVINQISRAITHQQADCLDPLVLLDTMWGGLEQSTKLAREDQEHLEKLFTETRQAYEQMARRQVQKAFVENFDQVANDLVQRYLRGVDSFLENPDQHTGRIGQPDGNLERFMRSLERSVDIQDYDKAAFRRAIHAQVTGLKNAGLPVNHQFDSRLEEAVIRKLCPGEREVARVLAPSGEQDPERLAKRDEVRQRLVREGGYHPDCAQRLLEHVSSFLNSDQRTSTQLPRALRWIRG